MAETEKEEFKRILTGEPVNWKEYALNQVHALVKAETREIDSDKKSSFFMELEKAIHEDMELTPEQIDSIGQIYVEWAKNKGRI